MMLGKGTEEFKIINDWLGWGDPIGGIWFIGVEEGKPWKCSTMEEIDKSRRDIRTKFNCPYSQYKSKYERDEQGPVVWPVATVSAKIAYMSSSGFSDWRFYRDEQLWVGDCKVFNGNILSLGKHKLSNDSWPPGYKELFGFSCSEYQIYFDSVREHRYTSFRKLLRDCHPSAIICFGIRYWEHFEELFDLSNKNFNTFTDHKTKVYPTEHIIFTRHFSNGMPDKLAGFIGLLVKGWVGEIP